MATKVSALTKATTLDNDDLIYIAKSNSVSITKQNFENSLSLNVNTNSRIVRGGVVWVSGLIYETVDLIYEINGTQYNITNGTQVTLSTADATNPRIDVIYGDDLGAISIEAGTPLATPVKPTIQEGYQIELTFATVAATATEPTGVAIDTLYLEDVGQPTEWDATDNTGGVRIDTADTTTPITGTKSIRTIDTLVNGDSFTLTNATPVNTDELSYIRFSIKLLNAWNNKEHIRVVLKSGSTEVGMFITDKNDIDITDLTTQTLTIFNADFGAFSGTSFDNIEFPCRAKGTIQYQIDDITLSTSDVITSPTNITGSDVSLDTTNFTTNLDSTITDVQKLADAVDVLVTGSADALEYQTEITVTTTLDGTQKGLNKLYPVNATTAKTITITTGDYVLNDVINLERRGQGTVEILPDTGVRIRGVRDIDNRYYLNDVNSLVSIICRGSEEFAVIGNLTRGYTGAVTTTSYSALTNSGVAENVTVIGTGFSSNMLDPVLTGNATLNSWVYVSQTQVTLNITETGIVNDTITVTYDNGDVFIDIAAITIVVETYDTANLRHYYPLSVNSDDAIAVSPIDGTDAGMTYSAGFAVFDGTTSKITLSDDDTFSYGDGTTDEDMSVSGTFNLDVVSGGRIACKWGNGANREFRVELTSTKLRLACFDENVAKSVTYEADTVLSTSTQYHFIVTKTGLTFTMYINGSAVSLTEIVNNVTYVAMENLTDDLVIGALSYSFSSALDGQLRRLGFWNTVLSSSEALGIYTEEVTNNTDLL